MTSKLNNESLAKVAQTLLRASTVMDENEDYWENRFIPYIQNIWPKKDDVKTEKISIRFAEICISAGNRFPQVFRLLRDWLLPVNLNDFTIPSIVGTKIYSDFPRETLDFLNCTISYVSPHLSGSLRGLLDDIVKQKPDIATSTAFMRLSQLIGG